MTRAELAQLVADYLHRDDMGGIIPKFIDLATVRLGRDLTSLENEAQATISATANPIDLPADFKSIRELTYGNGSNPIYLQSVGRSRIHRYGSGKPIAYSITGLKATIGPFSAGDYGIIYYQEPAALTSNSSTNAVLEAHPQLYLYATLLEAHTYTQDFELRAQALSTYQGELAGVNSKANAGRMGAAAAVFGDR
jgi:hypothetical protein